MRALGVSELLIAWEQAYGQRPATRAITLVAAASEAEDGDPRLLPVGEREARLLSLREATFGGALESVADCGACGEKMAMSFKTSDVRAPVRSVADGPLVVDGYEVEWRLPTSADLVALEQDEGTEDAAVRLLERCVLRATHGDEALEPTDLPESVRDALARAVEAADPQADVELTISCPQCGHVNVVPFDMAAFFWDELNAWAFRTLQDVHVLASAYGWSERDVLAMTSFRRQVYMEMVGA
jgi:hypothetical protein